MRLFLYYAYHSVLNTLKKVFKTWVAVVLIASLFGLVVGLAGSFFSKDAVDDGTGTTVVDTEESTSDSDTGSGRLGAFMEQYDISTEDIVDLAISAVFLLIFALDILHAEDSGKIFQPADVPMLFASPIKPQSVLMFRLVCTLGGYLLASLFMLFQIPNLIDNAGFSVWGAFSIVVVYALVLMFSTLAKVVFYTVASKIENGASKLKPFLMAVYGAIALGFVAYTAVNKLSMVDALFGYFAGSGTHWVPFWGWMRGISYYAVTGDTFKSLLYLVLFIVACAVLVIVIWSMKANFYEDAMFAAEHKAEQIDAARKASKGAVATRAKERKASLDREGFRYGSGANVFFYKAVFNRFRFATLKILSKTMIIYTFVACIVAWFARRYTGGDAFFIPAAALGIMAFYRTLGDPIREDTTREFFMLIPAKPYAKIFYSLLGCLAVTAIDLLLPMTAAAVILGANPLSVLAWLAFILSVSFFATVVGTLISLSLPKDQAQTLAMVVQMIFLYFGITPSAAVVIIGILTGYLIPAILIGAVMNFGAGMLVSLILPKVLRRK